MAWYNGARSTFEPTGNCTFLSLPDSDNHLTAVGPVQGDVNSGTSVVLLSDEGGVKCQTDHNSSSSVINYRCSSAECGVREHWLLNSWLVQSSCRQDGKETVWNLSWCGGGGDLQATRDRGGWREGHCCIGWSCYPGWYQGRWSLSDGPVSLADREDFSEVGATLLSTYSPFWR